MQFSLFEKSLELSKRVVLEQAEKKINGQLASPRLPGSGRRGDVRLCLGANDVLDAKEFALRVFPANTEKIPTTKRKAVVPC